MYKYILWTAADAQVKDLNEMSNMLASFELYGMWGK